jgi:hypothetical protein
MDSSLAEQVRNLSYMALAPRGGGEQRRFIVQAADKLNRQREALGR